MYDATAFVTKNMDALRKDLHRCAAQSANAIVANELSNDSMLNAPSSATKKKSP